MYMHTSFFHFHFHCRSLSVRESKHSLWQAYCKSKMALGLILSVIPILATLLFTYLNDVQVCNALFLVLNGSLLDACSSLLGYGIRFRIVACYYSTFCLFTDEVGI